MRVLVTGGSGLLGRHVIRALSEKGHVVRRSVRADKPGAGPFFAADADSLTSAVACNLLTGDGVAAACEGVDAVVHLALDTSGSVDDLIQFATLSTTHLLGALRESTKHFILASSFSVYDWDRVGQFVTEESPLHNAKTAAAFDGYTRAKVAQERTARHLCDQWCIGLTVLRPAKIWTDASVHLDCIGPQLGPIRFVIGPARTLRLTYVKNCASAFAAAVDDRAVGRTFNIVDGFNENAWRFSKPPLAAIRVPVPSTVASVVLRLGAAVYRRFRRGRPIPGLLTAARFRARFHRAAAGHVQLTRVLGWVPPFSYQTSDASGGIP